MRRLFLLLAGLMLALVACQGGDGGVSEPAPESVTEEPTTPPEVGPVSSRVVQAEGRLVAMNPALALSFERGGVVLSLDVQVGDRVQAGDLIATLDDSALQEAVVSAALQVRQAENNLAQVQLALDMLRTYLVGDENLSWKAYLEMYFEAAGNPMDLPVSHEEHPLFPDVIMYAGRNATVSYEPDCADLGYTRNNIRPTIEQVVLAYG